jgi:hypothetical protein
MRQSVNDAVRPVRRHDSLELRAVRHDRRRAADHTMRFKGGLQPTAPVMVRSEYGSGSAATSPVVWIRIRLSTDGAGTLTGDAVPPGG